jgi:hypothetical protein
MSVVSTMAVLCPPHKVWLSCLPERVFLVLYELHGGPPLQKNCGTSSSAHTLLALVWHFD